MPFFPNRIFADVLYTQKRCYYTVTKIVEPHQAQDMFVTMLDLFIDYYAVMTVSGSFLLISGMPQVFVIGLIYHRIMDIFLSECITRIAGGQIKYQRKVFC